MTGAATYKGWWPMLEEMPAGWSIDRTAGSPVHGFVFITNGRSPINGQERALLRAQPKVIHDPPRVETTPIIALQSQKDSCLKQDEPQDPALPRTLNELARARMKYRLLADIRFDLQICELENWSKHEYIRELKGLIDSMTQESATTT